MKQALQLFIITLLIVSCTKKQSNQIEQYDSMIFTDAEIRNQEIQDSLQHKNIKIAIKWNGITVKKFSNDIILNNCTVKYDLIDDELPDYSIEELLEKYCDKQYLILMAVLAQIIL